MVSSSISSVLESCTSLPAAKGGEVTGGASGRLGLGDGPWQGESGRNSSVIWQTWMSCGRVSINLSGYVVCEIGSSQILTERRERNTRGFILGRRSRAPHSCLLLNSPSGRGSPNAPSWRSSCVPGRHVPAQAPGQPLGDTRGPSSSPRSGTRLVRGLRCLWRAGPLAFHRKMARGRDLSSAGATTGHFTARAG